jgi:hypothetical protein
MESMQQGVKVEILQQEVERLPHEKDQSTDQVRTEPEPLIEQAAVDLKRGLVDTDRAAEVNVVYRKQKRKTHP